ncbi:MAG TPA: hypothetical protein VL981_01650 [Candidatus Methylacidiphilales bacterium]|nr:hypothetical protein [Candidatus Methylacidiphilales bacterium]
MTISKNHIVILVLGVAIILWVCVSVIRSSFIFMGGVIGANKDTLPISHKHDLQVTISSPTGTTFDPLEPIPIDVVTTNISNEKIYLGQSEFETTAPFLFRAELYGKRMPLTEKGKHSNWISMVSNSDLWLNPGESYKLHFIINLYCDMTMDGRYDITIGRYVPNTLDKHSELYLSNTLSIVVR